MKLSDTDHPYYCEKQNYMGPVRGERTSWAEYACWADFKERWIRGVESIPGHEPLAEDDDLNFLFRWDWRHDTDWAEFGGEFRTGTQTLFLFYMLQRKGHFLPVIVRNMRDEDELEVREYLSRKWDCMLKTWEGVSQGEAAR